MAKSKTKISKLNFANNNVKIAVIVIVSVVVGAVGTYMVTNSNAQVISGTATNCGSAYGDVGEAYVKNLTYNASLKSSDSVRNLAKYVCQKGFLNETDALKINSSGNWSSTLSKAIKSFELSDPRMAPAADGLPDAKMICALSEYETVNNKSGVYHAYGSPFPVDFPNTDCYNLLGTTHYPYGK